MISRVIRVSTVFLTILCVLVVGSGSDLAQCTDDDGDGSYFEGGCGTERDCNDADPFIYPGTAELCDGYDNDCNGVIDDNCAVVGVHDEPGTYLRTRMLAAAPNPTRAHTSISFEVAESGDDMDLRIYDARGRLVRTLVDGTLPGGLRRVSWDGRDGQGRSVATGIYYLRMLTPRERQVMELVVEGNSNKVIAIDLGVSERTVEIHRGRVMRKMGAESLPHLVRMVIDLRR